MTVSFEVRLTAGAEADLEGIHKYLSAYASRRIADGLLGKMLDRIDNLERFPDRGVVPKELRDLGIADFRQTNVGKYRLVYRVLDRTVYIILIADGRREMQNLLAERLLYPA